MYFPIRGISNDLGATVSWDQVTDIILITQRGAGQSTQISEAQIMNYLMGKASVLFGLCERRSPGPQGPMANIFD
ncbi:hypothetical protein [Paenibacillus aestuarii]|uniref:Copper amine oxidase-like N-terminal domain-containing protein n=1 Tax=Paenibacillus aestuarii TaxID=516965 RepID=A0ABW0KBC8_9BACL